MKPTGPVHFIHLGGEVRWQHLRAISTAKRVHGSEVWFWSHDLPDGHGYIGTLKDVTVRHLDLPDWLRDHPIQLANVKDLYAWQILHDYGGLYLDLDTISLRPVWDLLDRAPVIVSTEHPPAEQWEHPYNSAVVVAQRGEPILAELHRLALKILESGEDRWGKTGPHLLTPHVGIGGLAAAPFPLLSGWSYHSIGDYYANPRDPGEDVRVIHLYSSDHPEWLEDRWMP